MRRHDVLVIGAGPSGLFAAGSRSQDVERVASSQETVFVNVFESLYYRESESCFLARIPFSLSPRKHQITEIAPQTRVFLHRRLPTPISLPASTEHRRPGGRLRSSSYGAPVSVKAAP
jgi:hypothetical protein